MAADLKLASLRQLLDELQEQATPATDSIAYRLIVDELVRATAEIEDFLGYQVISDGVAHADLFDVRRSTPSIRLRGRPVSTIQVWEDAGGTTYDSTTLLVDGTDYMLDAAHGDLYRLPDGGVWPVGVATVKVSAKYGVTDDTDKTNVPAAVRAVCLRLAAIGYREAQTKEQGRNQRYDVNGGRISTMSRSLTTTHLTEEMEDQINRWRHITPGDPSIYRRRETT